MFDDIYHACIDYMAAFETDGDIDEAVEKLRGAILAAGDDATETAATSAAGCGGTDG